MRPWDLIDHEDLPHSEGTMFLMKRGSEYVIHVDGRELMGNKEHGSEDALADLACDRLEDLENARILVGGLGMGFTLAAALRRVGAGGQVTVAEIMPSVVRWNREYVGGRAKHPLRDPRSAVFEGDIADLILQGGPEQWSAILLDVDNGPTLLSRSYNGWLYTKQGLAAAHAALIPGGILGVWSACADSNFTRRLRKMPFDVEVLPFTEEGRPTPEDDGKHVLWMARRR